MIIVKVRYLDDKLLEEHNILIEEGSDITALLMQTDPLKNPEDYFYIIDGAIKSGSYKLTRGDSVIIFPAMCGG
jgi:molybdopterin converting factor small subunit